MLSGASRTPEHNARLLVAAKRSLGDWRTLGDVEGHSFHGNQWTGSGGERWRKDDAEEGRILHGVPLSTVDHPDFSQSINHDIVEPPLVVPKGKHVSAGIVVTEPDGSVWVVEPHNRYGGYRSTFPKGTVDEGESLQETAAREVWEESGLVTKVTGHLVDVERTTSVARFYTGVRVGGAPWAAGKETHAVKLIPIAGKGTEHTLKNVWGKPTSDHKVLDALRTKHRALGDVEGHEFHGNQWTAGAGGHPEGYEWKPKAGSASGLYAYHKNGVQVSKGFPKGDAHKAVATINNGKGPDVVASAAVPASANYPTDLEKISGAKGSNEGGVYKDKEGQQWYVKKYGNADQAASEHVANEIYRAVGAKVPVTALGPNAELASKWMSGESKTLGQTGVTKESADKILDHYAADVFTANWDAVGTGHDNVLVGKDGSVARVDQGGTLLFRAQGGLKPEGGLGKIGEWKTLADPQMNPYYAKVFKAAGLKDADALGHRAIKQIDKIVAARPKDGWHSFVKQAAPNASKDFVSKVGAMLESRQKGLEAKRDELKTRSLGDVEGHEFHGNQWTAGSGSDNPVGISDRLAQHKGMEMVSVEDLRRFETQDRRVEPKGEANITEPTETLLPRLTSELQAGGKILEPLTIAYDHKAGKAILIDGNTRLAAIKDAGFTHAPVVISRQSLHGFGGEAPGRASDEAMGADWVRPSDIGLSVMSRRMRSAGDIEGHEFHGNQWTEGQGAGPDPSHSDKFSGGSGDLVIKQKASAAASKDQIKQIVEMKKAGKSMDEIHAATGVNPVQASNILYKHNNAEKAISELLVTKPDYSQFGNKATMKQDPDTKKWIVKDEHGKVIIEKDTKGMAQAHMDVFNNKSFTAKTEGVVGKADVFAAKTGVIYQPVMSAGNYSQYGKVYDKSGQEIGVVNSSVPGGWQSHPKEVTTPPPASMVGKPSSEGHIVNAKGETFVWQEKTAANSPNLQAKNAGKYAYFKNGVQVSAAHAKEDHEKAAASINQGKGPNYEPPPQPSYTPSNWGNENIWGSTKVQGIEVEKGAGTVGKWPIDDKTSRVMGSTTPTTMENIGTNWSTKLTAGEHKAVHAYTGSTYHAINEELRAGGKLTGSAAKIQSALDKSPSPPPPDLVWRGISNDHVGSLASTLGPGDVIELKGFQSSTIKPEFAHSWGSGKTVFEIKPSKGAYVRPISMHKHEYEYLIPHGAKYTVQGSKVVKIGGMSHKVIQLEMH